MKKLLLGTALVSFAFLAGCGEDEREAKIAEQNAQIEANQTLLGIQEETFRLNVERQQILDADLAEKQAALQELQAQIDALQPVFTEAANAAQAVSAAEARLAELQAQSAELQSYLDRIEEFRSSAKLVNPVKGDSQSIRVTDLHTGKDWNTYRYIEPKFNLVSYLWADISNETLLSTISERAAPRLQACLDGDGCIRPQGTHYSDLNRMWRIIDWDAGMVLYTNGGESRRISIYPFEHFGEEFAAQMHAQADALRAELIANTHDGG